MDYLAIFTLIIKFNGKKNVKNEKKSTFESLKNTQIAKNKFFFLDL